MDGSSSIAPVSGAGVSSVTAGMRAASAEPALGNTNFYSILHTFGTGPKNSLVAGLIAVNGTLYGTTAGGGTYGYGTIFSITPAGKFTALYNFTGGADGANPESALTNVDGKLYRTASAGGGYNNGTVFYITPAGVFLSRL